MTGAAALASASLPRAAWASPMGLPIGIQLYVVGKPMAAMVHGMVGTQHAAMAIYNAYCDRVPMLIFTGNAGPLNSSSLVHRSLSLMSELSPGYLQQFLSYVDALSWMEQMNGGGALPAKDAPRATSSKKNTKGKSR